MKEKILLSVTGLTPQVVTETLYALAVLGDPPFVPDAIHVITTNEGASRLRLTLLEGEGHLSRLIADYGLTGGAMRLDADTIHRIPDSQGSSLDDIRSLADNQAAADAITEIVRDLTENPESTIHASIAGGRKTMGFYLGYALSLFGRPQDRLSHVLVSEPFESHYQFFFPSREPKVLFTRDSKPVSTADARITLADIPFVRLRDGLPERLLKGQVRYSEAVSAVQRTLDETPRLIIDLDAGRLLAAGCVVSPQAADLAFYAWLARRRANREPGLRIPVEYEQNPTYARDFLTEYRAVKGPDADLERTANALERGMDKAYFEARKTRINKVLATSLGAYAAKPYVVTPDETRPRKFGLTLQPEQIFFRPLESG